MRQSLVFVAAIIAASDHHSLVCSSLPFGSRAKKSDVAAAAEDEVGNDATTLEREKSAVRGAASRVSQSQKQDFADAPPVVRAFFEDLASSAADDEDSDSSSSLLGKELREMSNAADMQSFLESTRRALHRNPELMYELPFTSDTIHEILTQLDIPHTTGWARNTHPEAFDGPGGYGIVAHVGTGEPPCVILRADMDALPIREATRDVDSFRSHNDGRMHACGHDGHVTMLLGAAALLKSVEGEMRGTVRLVFQPAEEGGAGMKRMVEEGLVEGRHPVALGSVAEEEEEEEGTMGGGLKAELAFGMHVWPT